MQTICTPFSVKSGIIAKSPCAGVGNQPAAGAATSASCRRANRINSSLPGGTSITSPMPPASACGNRIRHRRTIGVQLGLDFSPNPRTGLVELIDVRQMLGQQEPMMWFEGADERCLQRLPFGPQASLGEVRQNDWIGLAGQERVEHGARRLAQDVGDDRGELQIGVLQHFLHAVDHACALGD